MSYHEQTSHSVPKRFHSSPFSFKATLPRDQFVSFTYIWSVRMQDPDSPSARLFWFNMTSPEIPMKQRKNSSVKG